MLRILVTCLGLFAFPAVAETPTRTISVTGIGTVHATPDQATIRLGVQAQARTAREALASNTETMQRVIKVLVDQNIDEKDMQTTQLALYPQFENRTPNRAPAVIGFTAQNNIMVTVQHISSLGLILDQVSQAGGNRIDSISFSLKDRETPMNEARRRAVKDGIAKATLYAGETGVTLGALQMLSDSRGTGLPQNNFGMARAESLAMDVPIAEGELALTAQVHMIFVIE